jgi:catechol-2,3-dioxygenase
MRVHHLALRTADLPRLEAFYVGVLGLTVSRRHGERSVWLEAGETILMLERKEPGEPPLAIDSLEMFAFAIAPHRKDEFLARLATAKVALEGSTTHTLYFRDPDGRRVGLSAYPEKL